VKEIRYLTEKKNKKKIGNEIYVDKAKEKVKNLAKKRSKKREKKKEYREVIKRCKKIKYKI
jgi:hypothetical protein